MYRNFLFVFFFPPVFVFYHIFLVFIIYFVVFFNSIELDVFDIIISL